MKGNKTIAFFDFDGTITKADVFWKFIRFRLQNGLHYHKVLLCLPVLIIYALKLIGNEEAKMKVFSILFKGESVDKFMTATQMYFVSNKHKVLKIDAVERIAWHQANNHAVVIVSANFEPVIQHFATELNTGFIGTQIQVINNLVTGKFSTPNCYGPEKVKRIKMRYNLGIYDTIYAYGDSKGDKEMLEIATRPHYRFFK